MVRPTTPNGSWPCGLDLFCGLVAARLAWAGDEDMVGRARPNDLLVLSAAESCPTPDAMMPDAIGVRPRVTPSPTQRLVTRTRSVGWLVGCGSPADYTCSQSAQTIAGWAKNQIAFGPSFVIAGLLLRRRRRRPRRNGLCRPECRLSASFIICTTWSYTHLSACLYLNFRLQLRRLASTVGSP